MHRFSVLSGKGFVSPVLLAIIVLLAQTEASGRRNSFTIDSGAGLERELQIIFNNNIELTQQILQILDTVPISEEAKKYATQYINTVPIYTKRDPIRTKQNRSPADKIIWDGHNVMRAVLAKYLFDKEIVGSRPFVSDKLRKYCYFIKRPKFFDCCDSCCPPCRFKCEDWDGAIIKWTKYRSYGKRAHKRESFHSAKYPRFSDPFLGVWPLRWNQYPLFFDHFMNIKNKNLREALNHFLVSVQTVNGTSLGADYFELVSATLAGIGFNFTKVQYDDLMSKASHSKQTGVVVLLDQINKYADYNDQQPECERSKYCVKPGLGCPSAESTGGCDGCLDCKSFGTRPERLGWTAERKCPPPPFPMDEDYPIYRPGVSLT